MGNTKHSIRSHKIFRGVSLQSLPSPFLPHPLSQTTVPLLVSPKISGPPPFHNHFPPLQLPCWSPGWTHKWLRILLPFTLPIKVKYRKGCEHFRPYFYLCDIYCKTQARWVQNFLWTSCEELRLNNPLQRPSVGHTGTGISALFTHEETKVQRGDLTCPNHRVLQGRSPVLNSGLLAAS